MTDTRLRDLERQAQASRTVENLVALQQARFRAGLPGMGQEKLAEWWASAPTVLHEPAHPMSSISFEPNPQRLNGGFENYDVAIWESFDTRAASTHPLAYSLEIIVGEGDYMIGHSLELWPRGRLLPALFLEADLFASWYPKHTHHYDRYIQPIPVDLLQVNNYNTLGDCLSAMCEALFLYTWDHELLSAGPSRKCNNCGHDREIRRRHGHDYYYCARCLP